MHYKILAPFLALIAALSAWFWMQRIVIPHQDADAVRLGTPRGNLSDLYPRWVGSRELLLHKRDPYTKEVTREIQAGYYGRPLDATRPNDPKDQQAFAYPVYVAFLLAPTVKLPYTTVKREFFWILAATTVLSVMFWFRAMSWKVSRAVTFVWIVLMLGSLPVIQGLKLQQLSLLVAGMEAGAMWALMGGQLAVAGVLLALCSIKPQLVALPVMSFGLWTLGNWRERQRFIWAFGVTMTALIVGGEILLPGWISEFRRASAEYWKYTGGGKSVLDFELTPAIGRMVSSVLVLTLAYFAWKLRRTERRSRELQWLLALTMAVTVLVIPMIAPYNQILLLPALMMLIRDFRQVWQGSRAVRFAVVTAAISFFWPWVTAMGSVLALTFLPAVLVQKAWWVPWYTTFTTPTLIAGVLLLAGKAIRSSAGANAVAKKIRQVYG